jgi:hypothetical protein
MHLLHLFLAHKLSYIYIYIYIYNEIIILLKKCDQVISKEKWYESLVPYPPLQGYNIQNFKRIIHVRNQIT